MNIVPIQDVAFDDKATLAMGIAFDQACKSLRDFSRSGAARETLAKCIIEAAKNGERDSARLYAEALKAFRGGGMPMRMPIAGGDRNFPVPVFALVARTA